MLIDFSPSSPPPILLPAVAESCDGPPATPPPELVEDVIFQMIRAKIDTFARLSIDFFLEKSWEIIGNYNKKVLHFFLT